MRAFRNPQEFLKLYEQNSNPIVQNAISMYKNGDKDGINQLANNIAKEKGVDINQLTQQIKSQFGIN